MPYDTCPLYNIPTEKEKEKASHRQSRNATEYLSNSQYLFSTLAKTMILQFPIPITPQKTDRTLPKCPSYFLLLPLPSHIHPRPAFPGLRTTMVRSPHTASPPINHTAPYHSPDGNLHPIVTSQSPIRTRPVHLPLPPHLILHLRPHIHLHLHIP